MENTLGAKLVGLSFNPSQDPKVTKVKELCAELVNIIHESEENSAEHGTLTSDRQFLITRAKMNALNASESIVKLLTFK